MSSGFVSAGVSNPEDDDSWAAARAAVEAAKKPKEEDPQDHRSLYEILQANKAKKQEAFEESLKFKHQFKPLDEDDVEYLDSIIDTERRAEAIRRRELENQLDDFRRHQSEADKVNPAATDAPNEFGNWSAGRKKRKKEHAGDDESSKRKGLGLKLRKTSTGAVAVAAGGDKEKGNTTAKEENGSSVGDAVAKLASPVVNKTAKELPSKPAPAPATTPKQAPAKSAVGLAGLVAYGSDDDDD